MEISAESTEKAESPPGAVDRDAMSGTVRRAVAWRTGTQIVGQLISWSATLIVIRLLDPADYGLFAMAQVMMTFLDFLNGYGFASALIQSRNLERTAIRQALGITMLLNGSIAALQIAIAPLVAAYYGRPEVADLLRILAIIYLATPFIIIPEVILARGLDFRKQAIVNLSAAMVGATVSLSLAWSGFGIWTLIYAPIAVAFTRGLGLTIAARLFVLPSFDFRGAGSIARFGGAMMASHLLWVVQAQSDIFIAGRIYSPSEIGLYAQALFLTQLVMAKFVPALNQVAFPAYARMQDDLPALRWGFLGSVRLIMLATAPIYIGLAASAAPLVELLFGTKWLAMVPLVQVLAFAMPLMTLQILFAPMHNALGRPDLSVKSSACGALLFGSAFFIGAQFGTIGLATAWLIAAPLLLLATIALGTRLTGITARALIGAASPACGCALAMGGIVWLGDRLLNPHLPAVPHVLALVAIGGASYALLSWWLQHPTLVTLINLVRPRRPAAPTVQAPAI
jgi:O-antigen/teichoic acid export membrane protein